MDVARQHAEDRSRSLENTRSAERIKRDLLGQKKIFRWLQEDGDEREDSVTPMTE